MKKNMSVIFVFSAWASVLTLTSCIGRNTRSLEAPKTAHRVTSLESIFLRMPERAVAGMSKADKKAFMDIEKKKQSIFPDDVSRFDEHNLYIHYSADSYEGFYTNGVFYLKVFLTSEAIPIVLVQSFPSQGEPSFSVYSEIDGILSEVQSNIFPSNIKKSMQLIPSRETTDVFVYVKDRPAYKLFSESEPEGKLVWHNDKFVYKKL